MKFFDPKKKDSTNPNPPAPAPKPFNAQNPQPAPPPNPRPVSVPAQPAPAPIAVAPDPPKPEPKPEPVKVEEIKPEPLKMETPKPQLVTQNMTPTFTDPIKAQPATKTPGKTLIGNSVIIRGDITSDENLQIEGVVDGSIETSHDVLVGLEGRVNATIRAGNIMIQGRVIGDVTAANKVELAPSSLLQGNIRAPKLSIAETALFKGTIDMRPKEANSPRESKEKSSTAAPLEVVEK